MSESGQRPRTMALNTAITILTSLVVAVIAFISRESYQEMRAAHDDILTVKILMVKHNEFDMAIAEMKAKTQSIDTALASIRARQQSIELEIQRLKEHRP